MTGRKAMKMAASHLTIPPNLSAMSLPSLELLQSTEKRPQHHPPNRQQPMVTHRSW